MTDVAPRVVYVAGPYSAPNAWEREQNVRRAEEVAAKLWAAAVPAICVHTTARFMFGAVPEDVAIAADLVILERCHAVALAPGWMHSRGTLGEMRRAFALGFPIFAPENLECAIRFAHTGECTGEVDSTWWWERASPPRA